jgi:hypothetical protein
MEGDAEEAEFEEGADGLVLDDIYLVRTSVLVDCQSQVDPFHAAASK